MTSNEKPRPETFEDLTGVDAKPRTVATITLEPMGIKNGLLPAVHEFVAAARSIYGNTDIVVEHDGITIARPLSTTEKGDALEQAQKTWDAEHKLAEEAAAREDLAVGDPFTTSITNVARCRSYTMSPCDLAYGHHGDHFEIVDGRVASRTPRGGR